MSGWIAAAGSNDSLDSRDSWCLSLFPNKLRDQLAEGAGGGFLRLRGRFRHRESDESGESVRERWMARVEFRVPKRRDRLEAYTPFYGGLAGCV